MGAPSAVLYARVAGEPALEWLLVVFFIVVLESVLFTVILMRLRRFPWRQFRHDAHVAAALGAATAALAIGIGAIGDSHPAGMAVLLVAALATPLVHRRVL